MWKSTKDYFKFCYLAFIEKFPSRRYELLRKIVWPLAFFLIAWVLGAYFGIPIKSVVTPIYNLLPGLAWIIVAQVIVIAFLTCLIDGARRFHKRIIDELENRRVSETTALKRHTNWRVLIVSTLSRHVATIEEYIVPQQQPKPPLDKEILQNWLNGAEDSINQCFGKHGPDAIRKLHDCSKPLVDDLNEQILWVRKYAENLNFIINEQYYGRNLGPVTEEDEEMLKGNN